MRDNPHQLTRRRVLTGSALVGSSTLAGCLGGSDDTSEQATTSTMNNSTGTTSSTAGSSGSYSVSMAPMGEVAFDSVPQRWVAGTGDWADMGVALGLGAPLALWLPERFNSYHYQHLPDVSVDTSSIRTLYSDGVSKEQFYELDADIHVFDPNFLMNRFSGWTQADINELRENIAPYFGNTIFNQDYPWHGYRYYSIDEAFGKLAAAFQRQDRYEALSSVREEALDLATSRLPEENARPSVVVVYPQPVEEPDSFLPYPMSEGTMFAHLNTLGVRDAFGSETSSFTDNRGQVDYETLLEIDPDVLLLLGNETKSAQEFQSTVVSYLESQEIASQLSAVQNGAVYRGGGFYQGPIINLFLTERLGNALYPQAFGSAELFDRQQVADIIHGNT